MNMNYIKADDKEWGFYHAKSSGWLEPIEFASGEEKQVDVAFNFGVTGVVKDWSLVAWGTNGSTESVTIRHESDTPSDHFNGHNHVVSG